MTCAQVDHVFNERTLLRSCNHPFIVRLAATLQDSEYVYMMLDYVQGGELFSILQSTEFLVEPVASFYSACVTSALEHMHDKNIIYRDLKPENVLLDSQGYLRLCDFGFAKLVATKTFTLCGTPEYLAPEIILNQGHNAGADYWALGILTYEMLTGVPPFSDESDPMATYQLILAANLPEPPRGKPPLSRPARQFIEKLCTRDPAQRLGCMQNGSAEVRGHVFLTRINWRRLERKLLQAPYTPQLRGPMDTSSFLVSQEPPFAPWEFEKELTGETQKVFKDW